MQPTLRLGVVVAGLLPFPQPPRKQARLMTRAPSLGGAFVWAVQPSLSHPVDAAGLLALAGSSGPASQAISWRRQARPLRRIAGPSLSRASNPISQALQEAPPKRRSTVLMHVGDTPRSLTTLNRGSGSTNWVGFCGKRHVRLKPSNVERGLVRLTFAGRPLRTLGVLTAAAHSVPPGHLLPSLRARRSSSAPE